MRLLDDTRQLVHDVDGSIEPWLSTQTAVGRRVNTMTVCDIATIGIVMPSDAVVTCVLCLTGKRW